MSTQDPALPTASFPLLPLRNGVLFPGTVITIPVGRPRSIALVESLVAEQSIIGVAVQRDPRTAEPDLADLQPIGTFARVRQINRAGDRNYHLVVEGLSRFEIKELIHGGPALLALGEPSRTSPSTPSKPRPSPTPCSSRSKSACLASPRSCTAPSRSGASCSASRAPRPRRRSPRKRPQPRHGEGGPSPAHPRRRRAPAPRHQPARRRHHPLGGAPPHRL